MSSLLPAVSAQTLDLTTSVAVAEAGIVSRNVLQTPELRITLFHFAPGQELTTHTNRRRAVVHILEGVCDFCFDGRWQSLGAGTLLHLPPNHPHAVRANEAAFSMLLTLGADSAP